MLPNRLTVFPRKASPQRFTGGNRLGAIDHAIQGAEEGRITWLINRNS